MRVSWKKTAAAGTLVLAAAALLGPRVRLADPPEAGPAGEPDVPASGLDAWLAAEEAKVPDVRPGDAKGVVWFGAADSTTAVSVVYLHGFSADRHELDPVPLELARALGANLFYTRLSGHGRDGPAMAEPTAEDWLADTEEAMAVGRRIGGRVVLLGTSTGGTLATWAAAQEGWADDVAALILVSPNYAPRDTRARMLLWPWGGLIARIVVGPERCWTPDNEAQRRHWTTCYPTRALLPMMALAEHVRTMDPARIRTPVLVLVSPDDQDVDPGATERLFAGFASADKRLVHVEGSAAGGHHVLAGDILAPEWNEPVLRHMLDFVEPLVTPPDTAEGSPGR